MAAERKKHVMSVLGGGALLLCWLSGLKLTNRGQPGGHGPAGCLPCWLVGPLTFQKGDLAQQQPVYQGRVGDGRQGDGTEAGAKEGLWLRVRCRLAIDCDGQGCEEEKRDLGRLGLAGCPFFWLLQKGLFWGFEGPLFASITNTLCCLGGEGQQAQQAGGQKETQVHIFGFGLFQPSLTTMHCLHKLHCAPSPEALHRVSMMLTAVLCPSLESLKPLKIPQSHSDCLSLSH